jgi:hypothetical protein
VRKLAIKEDVERRKQRGKHGKLALCLHAYLSEVVQDVLDFLATLVPNKTK